MAHKNIDERREYVRARLDALGKIDVAERYDIARRFECSPSAVFADVVLMSVDFGGITRHLSKSIRGRVRERDSSTCQYCGGIDLAAPMIEHVVPYALGGVGREYNLVVACQSCNVSKRSAVWIPRNLDEITADRPEWRRRIVSQAVKDRRPSNGRTS